MDELALQFLFYRVVSQLTAVNIETTLKILVRAKLLMPARYKLIKVFNAVKDHEKKLLELNHAVMKGDQELESVPDSDDSRFASEKKEKRNRMIKNKIGELEASTNFVS